MRTCSASLATEAGLSPSLISRSWMALITIGSMGGRDGRNGSSANMTGFERGERFRGHDAVVATSASTEGKKVIHIPFFSE